MNISMNVHRMFERKSRKGFFFLVWFYGMCENNEFLFVFYMLQNAAFHWVKKWSGSNWPARSTDQVVRPDRFCWLQEGLWPPLTLLCWFLLTIWLMYLFCIIIVYPRVFCFQFILRIIGFPCYLLTILVSMENCRKEKKGKRKKAKFH